MAAPLRRRTALLLGAAALCKRAAHARQPATLREALARAHAMREQAIGAGDQPYGAVVWLDGRIVGEAPSRVITQRNVDAHAEREALRDAQQWLQRRDLGGAVLVSSSRPCALCEDSAARAGISRMVYGEGTDAGAPQSR